MDAEARLISVDIDPAVRAVARTVIGDDKRLEIVTEDVAEFLRGRTGAFDLIFADAMSGKHELLDRALALLGPGGLYVIDDMLAQASWPPSHVEKVPGRLAELVGRPELRLVGLAWS